MVLELMGRLFETFGEQHLNALGEFNICINQVRIIDDNHMPMWRVPSFMDIFSISQNQHTTGSMPWQCICMYCIEPRSSGSCVVCLVVPRF